MSALVFDIVRRYLEYRGYEVRHVMNYTDVDDKIIQRAAVEGVDSLEIAQRYIDEFDQHIKDLNILPATVYPRATEEINHIIEAVADLVEKDYAYPSNGDVYYRVEKFTDYGKLSGRKIEDMEAGFRIDVDDKKEHPMDFALWKAAKAGEPSWPSPWGDGRPGWHIECSVMSHSCLGEQIDIHGGGNDLIFPHHENEIAQSEAMHGKDFARFWMHNGMMQLTGEKMSKSIGNLVTIDSFLDKYEGAVLRMMILNSSYRSPITFNEETIQHAEKALKRLRSALRPAMPQEGWKADQVDQLEKAAGRVKERFLEAMDDDFNTAGALGHIFDFVKEINLARDQGADQASLDEVQAVLLELSGVFGLELDVVLEKQLEPDHQLSITNDLYLYFVEKDNIKALTYINKDIYSSDVSITEDVKPVVPEYDPIDAKMYISHLINLRNESRSNKDWASSDYIRDKLNEFDIILEDTAEGTTWHWK